MCGINLIIDKNKQLAPLCATSHHSPIARMMQSNKHRGPDHQEAVCQEGKHWRVFMGSNRLKIIGAEDEANQPFISDDQYTLLYNGAIYNFHELRNDLLSYGERFFTHSDTEVLSKLLIRNAESALPQLNGMFAFAFYNAEEEKLLLARDNFGMKPLFYYQDEQYFILSSDISGILASGLVKKSLNVSQISHYLQFKYAASPATFLENIFEFQPGNFAALSPNAPLKIERYKRYSSPEIGINLNDHQQILDSTETLLSDAILRHLIADVPCGLFLSGGIDSTLLLALIKKLGTHPVDTFTIISGNSDKSFGTQDGKYSRLAAQQYGNYHYEVPANADILDHMEDFVCYLDQPVADSAALLTYLLSKEAKKKVGVVLSGAGADELFGGYNRHYAYYHYLKNYAFFTKSKSFIQGVTQYFPTGFHHPFRSQFRLLKKFGQNLSADPQQTFLNFIRSSFFSSDDTGAQIISPSKDFVNQQLIFGLCHDLRHYLVSDVLAINDRMSMAHSLEMRMPFLDEELVNFSQLLPAAFKLHKGKKWILKSLLSRLGGEIYTHRKEGFGLPFGAWLHQDHIYNKIRLYLEDEQLPVYQFVTFSNAQQLLQQHRKRQEDQSQNIWALLILSAWLVHQFPRR